MAWQGHPSDFPQGGEQICLFAKQNDMIMQKYIKQSLYFENPRPHLGINPPFSLFFLFFFFWFANQRLESYLCLPSSTLCCNWYIRTATITTTNTTITTSTTVITTSTATITITTTATTT